MKIEFRPPRIEDKEWVSALMQSTGRESCEYCFGNLFIWSPFYGTKIACVDGFFVAYSDSDEAPYCFPMGKGDLRAVLDKLLDDARARGRTLSFFGVTEPDRRLLESLMPGQFRYEEDRPFFDYIYSRDELATLAGKKYHGKRNHIAAFERAGDWQYELITPENLPECIDMDKEWKRLNLDKNPMELERENDALQRAFDYYEALGLRGALLRQGGRVVAFTIGEPMSRRMFCTHFEKAFADVRGAYPMINREFAARTITEFPLVNREEDTGDEGLRKAKLSYHPVKLLTKYDAVYDGD